MAARRGDRRERDAGAAGIVIALAAGGVALLAVLGVGGFLAYRILSAPAGPGQPGPPGTTGGLSEVTVYPELLRLDEPSERFVTLLVPSGRGAGPVVIARPTDSPTLRADRLDWAQRRKGGSFSLHVRDIDSPRDVRPDGAVLAHGRLGAEVIELTPLSASEPREGLQPARGRDLLFVDRSRRVVFGEGGAVELLEGADGKKKHALRPAAAGAAFHHSRDAAVSPDGMTVAVWKDRAFELIDAETGQVRGRTGALALQGEEAGARALRPAFSPDGRRIVAVVDVVAAAPGEPELACWDVQGGAAPRRFAPGSAEGLWWGDRHVVAVPRDDPGAKGRVYDAATGNLVCALEHAPARRASVARDGALWFLAANGPDTTFVARVPYPARSIAVLAPPPGTTGVVRVLFQYPPD